MSLAEKLHPSRFTEISPKMAAIVGYVLGEKWTNPSIVSMTTTSDEFVMAMIEGDIGYNEFIGSLRETGDNFDCLIEAAGLTREEQDEAVLLFNEKIAIP